MEKIVWSLLLCTLFSFGQEQAVASVNLEQACLNCHKTQQIPDRLIYKRYLMKYSTEGRMDEAIFSYLKTPEKGRSIMPGPFFSKFPMKEDLHLDDGILRQYVTAYLEKLDLKKKLVLEK